MLTAPTPGMGHRGLAPARASVSKSVAGPVTAPARFDPPDCQAWYEPTACRNSILITPLCLRRVVPSASSVLRGAPFPLRRRVVPARHNYAQPAAASATLDGSGLLDTVETQRQTPFSKILCANRGEIAIRVFRAGSEMGLRTVAIYSSVDRMMPHRYKADESYQTGTSEMTPVQCYLDIEGIINLAKEQGVNQPEFPSFAAFGACLSCPSPTSLGPLHVP